jgi:DNA-binding CsgD family transcriptional regulator
MSGPLPLSTSQERGKRGAVAAEVEGLVRRLIRSVAQETLPGARYREGGEAEEILLDVEFDGIRCLIVRFHPGDSYESPSLSPREQEIARMVAKGYPNKTIAAVLDISSWTVCTHLRRIFAKLGVCSRAAMVARLLEEGLIGELRSGVRDARMFDAPALRSRSIFETEHQPSARPEVAVRREG